MTRTTTSPKPAKKSRPGLSPVDEHRLRRRLRQSAPSEPWVDAQIKSLHDRAADGQEIVHRFFDPHQFPPGGRAATSMRWCRRCGRYTPPNCITLIEHRRTHSGIIITSTLICDDCHIAHNEDRYRELYEAGLYLRPPGSFSFVRMADLLGRSKTK